MPVRAIPYYCNPAKIQSKTLSFTQTRPPRPLIARRFMPHQKSKTTKAKAKSWKSQQLSASVSAHNRHTNTHTHTCSIGRTLFPGFALCQQNCKKNHRTTGKKKQKEEQQKKNNIYFYHDNVAVPPPALPRPLLA